MFRLVAKRLGVRMNSTDWGRVPWGQIYAVMREMGYRLNSDQERMLTGAVIPAPQPENVITAEDIEAAIKQVRAEREEA